jgi:hypothetical protein
MTADHLTGRGQPKIPYGEPWQIPDMEVVGEIYFDGTRWRWRVDVAPGVLRLERGFGQGSSRSETRARKQLAKALIKAQAYAESRNLAEGTREVVRLPHEGEPG